MSINKISDYDQLVKDAFDGYYPEKPQESYAKEEFARLSGYQKDALAGIQLVVLDVLRSLPEKEAKGAIKNSIPDNCIQPDVLNTKVPSSMFLSLVLASGKNPKIEKAVAEKLGVKHSDLFSESKSIFGGTETNNEILFEIYQNAKITPMPSGDKISGKNFTAREKPSL